MIIRGLAGDVSYSTAAPYTGPAPQSYAGKALDFAAYFWLAGSALAVLWALKSSPAAQRRRGAIKRAKVQMRKARRLPRVGV